MQHTLPRKRFQRRFESFTCEHCKTFVQGNGYTDHCPICLMSKHVDCTPGDREHQCGGRMLPIGYSPSSNTISYRCEKCGYRHKVKPAPDDDRDVLTSLASLPVPEEFL